MFAGSKPLVTVITPTYNCAPFIVETIESVIKNGYENIEYIILDDGSTDGTSVILKEYENIIGMHNTEVVSQAASDAIETFDKPMSLDEILMLGISVVFATLSATDIFDFTVIKHANVGEQATVNKGLQMVSGEYFMIVNADDPLLPGAISKLVDFMEAHPDILCAYPDWNAINEDGTFRTHIKSREYDFIYMVRHHTCLPSVGSMFRSDIIKRVGYRDTSFRWLGDFDYWLRIGLAGKMARVPGALSTWRHRNGQASQEKNDRRAKEHIRLIEKFYSLSGLPDGLLRIKPEAVCWSYLVAASVSKSKRNMLCYVLLGLMHYPQILLWLEFYDALVRRANYILRR